MNFSNNVKEETPRGRGNVETPIKKSQSLRVLLHGDPTVKSDHYVDALQRFKRDYATIDRQQRQQRKQKLNNRYDYRRKIQIQRDQKIKLFEEQNLNKLKDIQKHSQQMHEYGLKKTAHTYSIPINPITLEYEKNNKGERQQRVDTEDRLNKLVRAHHLQTCSTSGYNIINGKPSIYVENMVPPNNDAQFHNKLSKYYERFRIKLPSEYETN